MAEIEAQNSSPIGTSPLSAEEQRVMRTLITALRRIRYGSVQIVVQDGRVVQIDTLEKQRINHKDVEVER